MYELKYLTTGNGICASDLENTKKTVKINLQQVSSISDIIKFHLPFSGTYKGDYAVVSMQNGDRFYIDKIEHNNITNPQSKGCPKCGTETMLMSGHIYLETDEEPYESLKKEKSRTGIDEIDRHIIAHFCEKCDEISDTSND